MEPEQAPVGRRCEHCGNATADDAYCGQVCHAARHCEINRVLTRCEERFGHYQWLRELAKDEGEHGIIYEVYNMAQGRHTALKVQPYLETFPSARAKCDNEMLIACRMSGRDGFLQLHDYWICNVWPETHVFRRAAEKRHLGSHQKLFYMEMQLAQGTLKDLIEQKTPIAKLSKWCFLFETLFALEEARRDLGFVHGDLHPGNIFFVLSPEPRYYSLAHDADDDSVLACTSLFRPLIGDFGNSALGVTDLAKYDSDLSYLLASMEEWKLKFIYSEKRQARVRETGSYEPILVALANAIGGALERMTVEDAAMQGHV